MVKTDFLEYLKKLYSLLICKPPPVMRKKPAEVQVQAQRE